MAFVNISENWWAGVRWKILSRKSGRKPTFLALSWRIGTFNAPPPTPAEDESVPDKYKKRSPQWISPNPASSLNTTTNRSSCGTPTIVRCYAESHDHLLYMLTWHISKNITNRKFWRFDYATILDVIYAKMLYLQWFFKFIWGIWESKERRTERQCDNATMR